MKNLGSMGGSRTLNSGSSMPQLAGALVGWESNLLLVQIVQHIVDGFVQETAVQTPFRGVVQPLNPKAIMLKPEGERAWTWLQIHVQASSPVKLNVNDRIMYNCRKYKIMGQNDYSANGYVEYHAIEDFQNG